MEISAIRSFNFLYVYLDLLWLTLFSLLLWKMGKRLALLVGLLAGVLYFLVDYGIFLHLLNTRIVTGANPFWLLLWLSFSYGITNFAWIWILLDKDDHAVEWSLLIISAWLTIALLSQNLGDVSPSLTTARGTDTYHGVMALILFIGYLIVILKNISAADDQQIPIIRLLLIGIGVQFSWEAVLLISGIRPTETMPLIVNSLIETNLGLPFIYFIHKAVMGRMRGQKSIKEEGELIEDLSMN